MNYIDFLADRIRANVPAEFLPSGDNFQLFRIYAVLLLALGGRVSRADVHNAWAAWMADRVKSHPALVPYEELDPVTAKQDLPFLDAIRQVAHEIGAQP